MAARQDEMDNLPDWVQALVKLGIPGGIAVFLVWKMAGGFDVVDVRLRSIEGQQTQMSVSADRMEAAISRSSMASERVLFVLRQICVQNAKTASDRRDCLQ